MSKLLHFLKPTTESSTPVSSSGGEQQSVIRQLAEIFLAQKNESALVNPKKAMNVNLVLQLFASVCFCLTSIFLRHFSNVGFQLIITALANLTFCMGAFYVINRQPDSMSVGACLGSGIVISILSLITAVYWGELSKCEEIDVSIRKYTCDNKAAMRVMCFFAVLLFIFQVSTCSSSAIFSSLRSVCMYLHTPLMLFYDQLTLLIPFDSPSLSLL